MKDDFKFKIINFMWNNMELTPSQRRQIAEHLGECEDTGEKCIPDAHRIVRGNQGGKYVLANLKFSKLERHKDYHCKELGGKKA